MKKPALIFVCTLMLAATSAVFAQPPEVLWTKTLNGQIGYSVFPSPDGGFVIGGYTTEDGYRDFYMCKVDDQGEFLWEKTFGNDDRNETMNAMIETSDGGFLLCGNRAEDAPYSSYADIYLVKTDADGVQEWYSILGDDGETESPNSVAETPEGGFIMCGSSWTSSSNGYDIVLTKVNELGAFEWKHNYDLDDGKAEHGIWVEVSADGDILVAGDTQAFNPNYDYDAVIMTTTPLGTLLSINTFGEDWPMYEAANRLLQCSDGSRLICGYQNDDGLDNNWYVVKTGSNGWTHVIGGTYHEKAFNACETADGGFAVTGNYHFENSWNSFIVRYTADGDTLWTKMWGDPDQSQNNYDIKQLDDGGFITVGSTAAAGENPGIYLTRLSAGTTGTGKPYLQSGNNVELVGIQPNPFNRSTQLSYKLNLESRISVTLFDVAGNRISKVLDKAEGPGFHTVIMGEGLVPGIYFCRLQTEGTVVVTKLVRTK